LQKYRKSGFGGLCCYASTVLAGTLDVFPKHSNLFACGFGRGKVIEFVCKANGHGSVNFGCFSVVQSPAGGDNDLKEFHLAHRIAR